MPSSLTTHPGVMAAPMDISDSEGSRGGRATSSLSVSRSSLKISKNNLRRAVTQPRPAPQVYKTEPSDFRSLVQQLTGTSPPADSSPIRTPKPLNPRLQKIAPPPLRPVFSYPPQHQHQALPQQQILPQQQAPLPQPQIPFNPGPRRYPLTPQRPPNFAVSPLSFSPLPALSPADQIWANIMAPLESPGNGAMRQLTQMMDASKQGVQPQAGMQQNSQGGMQQNSQGGMQQNSQGAMQQNSQGGMQQNSQAGMQQNSQAGMQQNSQAGMPQNSQGGMHHLPHTLAHNSHFPNFPHEFSRFSGASPGLRFSPSTLNSTLHSTGFNPGFSNSVGLPTGYGAFGGGSFSPSASVAMDNPFSFPDAGDFSRSAFS